MDVNICSKAFNSYEIPFISCDVLHTAREEKFFLKHLLLFLVDMDLWH